MAIYIKGMELPKDCTECTLSYLDKFGYPHCGITKLVISYGKTKGDCPLTEVPEPHGRLIDAGQLCKGLDERWTTANKNAEKAIADVLADVVVPILVSTPTVIEGSE